jgi:hypothetical protein
VEEKKKKRKKNNLTGRLTLKFQNNMEIDKILGGVSPLKKRQSSRGGAKAGKATSTASRRGGYAKSSGARGAGGRNVGGYNRHTRFQADKWTPPPSGGNIGPAASTSAPVATAPYSGGDGTNYSFDSHDVNTLNQTAYGGGGKAQTETTTEIIKKEKPIVTDFRNNCYDSNGKFLKGHIYVNSEGNRIKCELGGKDPDLETYEQKTTKTTGEDGGSGDINITGSINTGLRGLDKLK